MWLIRLCLSLREGKHYLTPLLERGKQFIRKPVYYIRYKNFPLSGLFIPYSIIYRYGQVLNS